MKFRIVVDSTVYLSPEEIEKYKIKVASLNIMHKQETVKELSVDVDYVYEKLDAGHHLTTSQPSPGEFLDIYEELLSEGAEKIFVICLAVPLSGTHQSANLARNMLDDPNIVHIFDSKMAAFGNEMNTLELAEMIEAGASESEIIKRIGNLNSTSNLIFTIESLHYVAKSGRLSKAKALIGTVLRMKPLIKMVEGRLDLYKAERTHKKVVRDIIKSMKETTENANKIIVRVLSKNSLEQARALEQEIRATFKNIKVTFNEYLGPVFSLHLGKTGYGVSWCTE